MVRRIILITGYCIVPKLEASNSFTPISRWSVDFFHPRIYPECHGILYRTLSPSCNHQVPCRAANGVVFSRAVKLISLWRFPNMSFNISEAIANDIWLIIGWIKLLTRILWHYWQRSCLVRSFPFIKWNPIDRPGCWLWRFVVYCRQWFGWCCLFVVIETDT